MYSANDTIKKMFSLIVSEICNKPSDNDIKDNVCAADLPNLYALSKAHDLAHLVASALSKRGLIGDDEVSRKLQKQMMLAVHRYSGIN